MKSSILYSFAPYSVWGNNQCLVLEPHVTQKLNVRRAQIFKVALNLVAHIVVAVL
jgi:hypothetical protein